MQANNNMQPAGQFNDIKPRTRAERAAQKDKERIEICRLKERTGGYHKYVDAALVHNPDPTSSHYVSESERFDKDFAVADARVRAQQFEKKQDKFANLRQERYDREVDRFKQITAGDQQADKRLADKVDNFNAGKKNQGGAAFNVIDFNYEGNNRGEVLKQADTDANCRAQIRARNLQMKGNGTYNILTGSDTTYVQPPAHERYNPTFGAAAQQIVSSNSNKQLQGPPSSHGQQMGAVNGSQASSRVGAVPGLY